ncbi:MAG: oligosaccharide flippase family protein [Myxococcota bacterium]
MRPWFPGWPLGPGRKPWREQLAEVRPMISFGLYTTGSRFLYRFYSDSDYLVLGKVVGTGASGLYAFAFRTVDDITKTLVGVVSQVAFPAFARLQHDKPELGRYLFGMARGATIFIGLVVVVIFVHMPDLLVTIGYEKWLDAVPLVRLFCVIGLLRAVLPILPQVLNALGHSRLVLIYAVMLSVVLPTAFLIGAQWGADGVAWAWLIAYPPASLMLVVFTARLLDQPLLFVAKLFAGTPAVVALGAIL